MAETLRALIVDDEPLAVERLQILCAGLAGLTVVGTARDGAAAMALVEALSPDLLLLDLTMPEMDGLSVARELVRMADPPATIFVTAHDSFAVEAFDLDAVDYVLKPVSSERLQRAVERVTARRVPRLREETCWLSEFWVPHRSELLRIPASDVTSITAERDYVRLHLGEISYLLLQTIAGLEARLDPERFVRVHRSTILPQGRIAGLRHEGLGVWSAETTDGQSVRIGKTYLTRVKALAGR